MTATQESSTSQISATSSALTQEQVAVVEASPDARILVTAGPGTGKTHVLIERLRYLVVEWGLSPGTEILVLSFSRSAVYEIRKRLSQAGDDVRYIRAQTFDSFATSLLAEFVPEGPWQQVDYDGRIRSANVLLRANREAKETIESRRHILIDEMQDLVGDRADFVKTVLDASAGGFTLLGDPAQGIYNFQLEGAARRIGSAALYMWVREHFGQQLLELSLTKNHRARTVAARSALWAGELLNATTPDYEGIKYDLDTLVMTLPSLGTPDHALPLLKLPAPSTALLCRDNGQALIISGELWRAGILHRLQRSASDRVLPGWIADAFSGYQGSSITRQDFESRCAPIADRDVQDIGDAWMTLKLVEGRPGRSLDIGTLAIRIRTGNVADELIQVPQAGLTVSTIHRAKGLEFERVVFVARDAFDDEDDEVMLAEETRTLYVALTRPKSELKRMDSPSMRCRYLCKVTDRWTRRYERWKFVEFEVRGSDIYSLDPAGGYLLSDCDPLMIQGYIREKVHVGDVVSLAKLTSTDMGEPRAYYSLMHNEQAVGVTNDDFSMALYRTLRTGQYRVTWPSRIENLFVESIDTVAGTEATARRCGMGECPIWLRVRASGLGRLLFERSE